MDPIYKRLVIFSMVIVSLLGIMGSSALATTPSGLHAWAAITGHSYSDGRHEAWGKLHLNNQSGKLLRLACTVTVTFATSDGVLTKATDTIDARVGAGIVRVVHFRVRLLDRQHHFLNVPGRAVAHCSDT